GVAHHPEVVFSISRDDVNERVTAEGDELLRPIHRSFLIGNLEWRTGIDRFDVEIRRLCPDNSLFEFRPPFVFPAGLTEVRTKHSGVNAICRKPPGFD